ncbi:hypothetical protein ACFQX7_35005 [Luedemannella flava]
MPSSSVGCTVEIGWPTADVGAGSAGASVGAPPPPPPGVSTVGWTCVPPRDPPARAMSRASPALSSACQASTAVPRETTSASTDTAIAMVAPGPRRAGGAGGAAGGDG